MIKPRDYKPYNPCTQQEAKFPVSILADFPSTNVPDGWLYCDGRALSRSEYSDLFKIIGVIYGSGDNSTTFNIPDYRGYFSRCVNTSNSGIDQNRTVGSKQGDALKKHNHGFWYDTFHPGRKTGNDWPCTDGSVSKQGTTMDTGDSETRPHNYAVYRCIKT